MLHYQQRATQLKQDDRGLFQILVDFLLNHQ